MRFAREPVKLRFDNVQGFRLPHAARFPNLSEFGLNAVRNCARVGIGLTGSQGTPLARRNTATSDIFARIEPFRGAQTGASRDIDENGSLPYKPRQLSAMTRSDRDGSFWAGNGPLRASQHYRTYHIPRQIARSAENDP